MRFSIHIDAGYLYAALATRETGSSNRAAIRVDEAKLIHALVDLAAQDSGMRALRVLWYDAGHKGVPSRDQERIGMIDGVKLRMGRVNPYGEQKGVDLRLGLDLVSFGVNRAVEVAYLLSGDDDITEAVTDAQDLGVQVKLITVPTADGQRPLSVAYNLLLAADGVITIPPEAIDRAVTRANAPTPDPAAPETKPVSVIPPPKPPPVSTLAPATPAVPSSPVVPSAPAAPSPAAPPPAAPPRPDPVYSTTTGESHHGHYGIDPDDIEAVARAVYRVWSTTATDAQRDELFRGRPNIPPQIDRILLTDLVTRTEVYDIPSDTRYSLRDQFWAVVDSEPPA